MARETIASVKAALAEAIAERDRANDRAGQYRREQEATEKAFIVREATYKKQIAALTEEGNQLRGMIRGHENELARRAGYMEAIEDAKPKVPRLIEAPEPERYEVARPGSDGCLEFDNPHHDERFGSPRRIRKGWWER